MTSIKEQVFFFVVEKHPWILTQFNEARPQEGACIKTESQENYLERSFENLKLDTVDDAKSPHNDGNVIAWLRNSCQDEPSSAIPSDPRLSDSGQNEWNTLPENIRDGTRNHAPNESRALALYHPEKMHSGQPGQVKRQHNNIRNSARHGPDDDHENRRKLRNRRKNKARRRNISRKLAQYNEWRQIIYCVNNQLLGPCGRPYSHSTPKPRWSITA